MTCEHCKQPTNSLVIHDKELWCRSCHNATKDWVNQSAMINTDDIPGGYLVRHGVCWPDGTPRKFYSKSEIRRAASEAGLTISGETPKLNSRLKERNHREQERKAK